MEPAAILIAALDIHVRRPGKAEAFIEHGQMAGAGIEPDIQNIALFAKLRRAAFTADDTGGQQLGAPLLLEADEFCRSGGLLTMTPTDEMRSFWTWFLLEFVRQADGGSPLSWRRFYAER